MATPLLWRINGQLSNTLEGLLFLLPVHWAMQGKPESVMTCKQTARKITYDQILPEWSHGGTLLYSRSWYEVMQLVCATKSSVTHWDACLWSGSGLLLIMVSSFQLWLVLGTDGLCCSNPTEHFFILEQATIISLNLQHSEAVTPTSKGKNFYCVLTLASTSNLG